METNSIGESPVVRCPRCGCGQFTVTKRKGFSFGLGLMGIFLTMNPLGAGLGAFGGDEYLYAVCINCGHKRFIRKL